MPPETISFPAGKDSDRFLSIFMLVHAISLGAIVFAGLIGTNFAMSKAIAAMISVVAGALYVAAYKGLKKLRSPQPKAADALRLSPEGLSGRPFYQMGLNLVPWTHVKSARLDGDVVEIDFAPLDPSSGKPADRISKLRIPAGENASASDLKQAIDNYPRP